ncbi:lipid-transfer protein [Croceicoccus estronivorus]|uniref:thiolase C-terminal domain-containing protein n=1 Tax=Croceicoccus estronivorus TaxID=1172626 RepID=UPI000833392B|nr:lipid-transfer protein [Croceicoccus estronivorus]OCC23545.1 lipid-transfer protein [Croceicoccus estronivorus]
MSKISDTAIVGIGQTEFSKNSGRSELQLAAEASLAAIQDAGLTPDDIDGMVTFTLDSNDELDLMRTLGMTELNWTARGPFGGGASAATIQLAAAAVASGAAKAVLVYRAFNERSGRRFGQPDPNGYTSTAAGPDFHFSYGLDTPAKIYSLWYQRYLLKYGVTNEDLGRYVVTARAHAATNPAAWYYGKPITLEDHQTSRWIVEPVLRLLDCCQESDGGVAMVVTSADRARDLAQPGVRVAAATQSHRKGGLIMFDYYREDLSEFEETRTMTERLWADSGLTQNDIDVAMIYENFSPVVFLTLEGHGFCKRGEAKDFIKDGHIGLSGSLPVNTNGGLLGEGYIHGMNNILEGVRQVRGTAANQIKDAKHVLVSASRSGMILGPL